MGMKPSGPLTFANEPRIWLGCLQCHSEGRLVGEWYPASKAAEVGPAELHGRPVPAGTHEEIWGLDVEGFPEAGEMGPLDAQRWGDLYTEVGDAQRQPFCDWVRGGGHVEDADGMPSVSDFDEAYCGEWDSFLEYAEQLAEDIGLLSDVPESLQPYVDMRKWARDLAYDYTVESNPDGGVYVFRSL